MTDLRKAAEAVLERWDSPAWEWKKQGPTADLMASLRTALAAEPTKPEPVAWRPRLSPNLCFHWSRPWNEGVPSEQTVDYWNQKGAGVEYAYAAPPALAAEPTKPSEEAEALRRDAERWRWHRAEIAKHMGRSPESIDASIDAAMKEGT